MAIVILGRETSKHVRRITGNLDVVVPVRLSLELDIHSVTNLIMTVESMRDASVGSFL
jgi:hypothetical protein